MPSFQGCNFVYEIEGLNPLYYDIVVHVTDATFGYATVQLEYHRRTVDSETGKLLTAVKYGEATISEDGSSAGGGGGEGDA